MKDSATDPPPQGGAGSHGVTLTLVDPFPPEVEAGAHLVAVVRASCASGCDLRGASVRVTSTELLLAQGTLESPAEASDGGFEATLSIQAPPRVGEWTCEVVMEPITIGAILHQPSALDLRSRVLPHATSLAVWVAESPVTGRAFEVSVGAKCGAGCSLRGQIVEIFDETGGKLGEAILGDAPHAGTTGLYSASVVLRAPERPGVYTRSARFASPKQGLPHEAADASFTFRSLEPPEHTVSVRVLLEGIQARKQGIEVRVGRYQAFTDETGVARIGVPKGAHEVTFWRADLEPVSSRIEVTADIAIDLVAGPRQFVDEDARYL